MSIRLRLDPVARRFGHYTAYTLRGELVRTTFHDLKRVVRRLRAYGFEPSPTVGGVTLEAAKTNPRTGEVHDASLRLIVEGDGPNVEQYHVHLWDRGDHVEIHSHLEQRPDVQRIGSESWSDVKQRLRAHYRGIGLRKGAAPSYVHIV